MQAAAKLAGAAELIQRQPAAIQLRYLQTLVEIGAEKNTTVVFPLPIDIFTSFSRYLEKAASGKGMSWAGYAVLSAFFGALVAIFGKIGVRGVDSNLAVALRTVVIVFFAWGHRRHPGECWRHFPDLATFVSVPVFVGGGYGTVVALLLQGTATGRSLPRRSDRQAERRPRRSHGRSCFWVRNQQWETLLVHC